MGFRDTVIGHETQKMVLQRSLQRGRLSSSYLFSGESGTGKALLAREFVKLLFCESPLEDDRGPDSCGQCPQCRKTDHGNHPDLMVVVPEGQQIKIEQIRSAQEFLSIRPLEAPRRVLIVDDAERMNESSQNAFLKTLEEPPSTALIILITMSPEMLLPTVRSRCFHLKFGLLNRQQTEEVLRRVMPDTSPERIAQLARLSMGRPGLVVSGDFSLDPYTAIEALRAGDLVPETKDREKLLGLLPFYELVLRDILVQKVSGDSRFYIFPELSGLSFSKNLTWTDIIELYMKLQWLKDVSVLNPNVSLMGNFLRSQLGVLYEGN
jgi:DNA polymerase-3 subunit delta'